MNPFVNQIVTYLHQHELVRPNTVLIVPSQRMIAYLQKALFDANAGPLLSPKIVTIDRWINEMSPEPIIEKTHLLFELYEIYKKNPVEVGVTGFDSFIAWGQTLIADFEEIDRYLIPSDQLFKNLKSIREIENWSFNQEELSKGQQKFMAFWDKLNPYYIELSNKLKTLGLTTKAKAYKYVAENIQACTQHYPEAKFVFAGFNALSEAEISIMKQLVTLGIGHVLLDTDAFYLEDKQHEAGQFHRVLLSRLGVKSLPFTSNVLTNKSMDIELVECPQFTSQAQAIGHELTLVPSNELPETLVLLASEQLLSSLLQNLPAQIGQANITIGLPLQQTVLKSWVELIFRIQETYSKRQNGIIYYKDFIQFIHHPFLANSISSEEQHNLNLFEQRMINRNWQIVLVDRLPKGTNLEVCYNFLFQPWNGNWKNALQQIQGLNLFLDERFSASAEMEQAIIRKFGETVVEITGLFDREIPEFSLLTFKQIFQQHWSNDSIAYFGNPLDGLQIMGLLETRGIDFKRIFVMGMNEGEMPPTNPINTLIPMDLRKYFGLPTPREKQGLFAHHFYRLLHHCEKLFITYTSSQEAVGSNEPSRYVQQLKLELARVNPNIRITERFMGIPTKAIAVTSRVEKNESHLHAIDELLNSGITFSQIEKYLKCSLNYYYLYLLKFKEKNELEEELEANTKGTILHHVMENLYRPYLSTPKNPVYITPDLIKSLEGKVPLYLDEAFKASYSDDISSVNTGINHIFYVFSRDIILSWLKKERQLLEKNPEKSLQIIALEENFQIDVELEVNGAPKNIKLKGVIDRVDKWGDDYRVLDYKSGVVKSENVQLKNKANSTIEEIAEAIVNNYGANNSKDHALQLMIYSFLYFYAKGKFTKQTGIISFNNISGSPYMLQIANELSQADFLSLIKLILSKVLEEMYDLTLPFEHNSNSRFCAYCGKTHA